MTFRCKSRDCRHRGGLALLAALSLVGRGLAEELVPPGEPVQSAPAPVLLPSLVRDADRRVSALASNNTDKLLLLRWADDRIGRMERLTQIPRASDDPEIRIVLAPARPGAPPATVVQRVEPGGVVQRLTLDDGTYTPGAADEALCRALVFGYVMDHWESVKAGRAFDRWVEAEVPAAVPDWLWQGLAGCLDASSRASSSERIAVAWRTGRLVSLVEFLRTGWRPVSVSDVTDADLQRAFATMLMVWFCAQPDPGTRLDMLCVRLAAGERITPEIMAATLSGNASVVDLEERWDAWVLAQGRKIYSPGDTRLMDLQRLQAALMVSRGMGGIPATAEVPAQSPLRVLADHRDAAWIHSAVSVKRLELRTLALGRGHDLQNVVEAYCAFLDAVTAERKPRDVESLWVQAELAHRQLEDALVRGAHGYGLTAPDG